MDLSKPTLKKMFPHALPEWLDAFADLAPSLCVKEHITTPRRWNHFCAQIHGETGLAVKHMRENLNYDAAGLLRTFPGRVTVDEAHALEHKPVLIAEHMYGHTTRVGKMLGNTQAGDGAKFIGRGPLQPTGRFNYTRLGTQMGVDLPATPELLETPSQGITATFATWTMLKGNDAADKDNILAVTKRINGGKNGLDRRRVGLARAQSIWGNSMAPSDFDAPEPADAHHDDAVKPNPPPIPAAKDLRKAGSRPAWVMSLLKWFGVLTGATGFGAAPVVQFLSSPSITSAKDIGYAVADIIRDHDALLGLVVGGVGLVIAAIATMGLAYLCRATHVGRYIPLGWIVATLSTGRVDLGALLDSETAGDRPGGDPGDVGSLPVGAVGQAGGG